MTLSARNPRPKKCAVSTCRAPFVPVKSFQTWCSPECGIVIARQKQEKERKSIQQCRDGEIVNGELIGVYDCDPVTEAVCTARNDVMIESLGVCCG
ncbi:recombination protein NinG [Pseudomonas aeruginosa]|uniref:recombination protein NinG n=1 Tax=Pseudomonas aeruginosa TaxID=287 RepID=UPI002FEF14D7